MRNRATTLFAATGLAAALLAGCGGGDDAEGSVEAFCGMESDFNDLDPDFSTEKGMQEASEALQQLEDAAPEEIKSDVASVRAFFDEFGSMMDPEAMTEMSAEELEELMAQVETAGAEMETASANIESFIDANCG